MTYPKLSTEALDKTLTANNAGFKVDLFLTIDEDYICTECHNICRKAVSLICKYTSGRDVHSDADTQLYCESCITTVIQTNGNRCPITNHISPDYAPSKLPRKKILKARVICPNSIEYQQRTGQQNTAQGCTFTGTLESLIEDHIHICMDNQRNNNKNESQLHLMLIKDLQENNGKMEKEIRSLKNDNTQMKLKIQEMDINYHIMQQKIIDIQTLQEMMQNEMKSNADTSAGANTVTSANVGTKANTKVSDNKSKNLGTGKSKVKKSKKNMIAFEDREVIQIPLGIHSCRKIYLDRCHPRHLLESGTDNYYGSALISNFTNKEKDWIIFEMKDEERLFLPTQVKILNYNYTSGIACMEIMVGSVDDDRWHKLHVGGIEVEKQEESLQLFELNGYGKLVEMAGEREWRYIKVYFTENYGMSDRKSCKFICHEIQFHGRVL